MNTRQKTCFKCNKTKPCTEFYRHAMMADGYLGKRKECTRADVRNSRGDHTREYDMKRYRDQHLKHAARQTSAQAVRRGKVEKPPACWYCGRGDEEIEGHHADYNESMGVVWLCKTCHGECHSMATALTKDTKYAISLRRRY